MHSKELSNDAINLSQASCARYFTIGSSDSFFSHCNSLELLLSVINQRWKILRTGKLSRKQAAVCGKNK